MKGERYYITAVGMEHGKRFKEEFYLTSAWASKAKEEAMEMIRKRHPEGVIALEDIKVEPDIPLGFSWARCNSHYKSVRWQ